MKNFDFKKKSPSLSPKRKSLLRSLKKAEKEVTQFKREYQGPGFLKKVKRFFRYPKKYLQYCWAKATGPRESEADLFWEKRIKILLPDGWGIFQFGILPSKEEIRLIRFLINNVSQKSVFYDIGAHFGFYSFLIREIAPQAEVHLFEPNPLLKELLEKNFSKQHLFLNFLALSFKKGKTSFFVGPKGKSESSTLKFSFIPSYIDPFRFKKRVVSTVTLDQYSRNHSPPDFIKIDVEGAEFDVVKGGEDTLENTDPVIAMEVWKKPLRNESHLRAIQKLYDLDFKSFRIDQKGELEYLEEIKPERMIKGVSDNFIFKKKI